MPRKKAPAIQKVLLQGLEAFRTPRTAFWGSIRKDDIAKMIYFRCKFMHCERQSSRSWTFMPRPFSHGVNYGLQSGHQPQIGRLAEEHPSIDILEDICNVPHIYSFSKHPDRSTIQEFRGNDGDGSSRCEQETKYRIRSLCAAIKNSISRKPDLNNTMR